MWRLWTEQTAIEISDITPKKCSPALQPPDSEAVHKGNVRNDHCLRIPLNIRGKALPLQSGWQSFQSKSLDCKAEGKKKCEMLQVSAAWNAENIQCSAQSAQNKENINSRVDIKSP